VFRFGSILGAIGSALSPTRIGIGMFTLALLVGGGRIWDAATTPEPSSASASLMTGLINAVTPGEDPEPVAPFQFTLDQVQSCGSRLIDATVGLEPAAFLAAGRDLLWTTPASLWNGGHHWFILLFGLWTAASLALGGGVLCRLEAVGLATRDAASVNPALGMVAGRWQAFFAALLMPLVMAALLALLLLVFGLVLLNAPVLNLLGAVLYGAALLVGLGIALLLLAYAVSCPLLLPAVAAENCDGPDAMHRAIAYIVAKPLRWMLYLFTLMLGLALGLLLVLTVANLTIDITAALVDQWTFNETFASAQAATEGGEAPDASWHVAWAGGLVSFWSGLVQWAVAGWVVAYLMAGSTRAYLLLRLACDGQDEREIWWPGLIRGTLAPEPPNSQE
jgi:hypothetical protein